MTLYSNIIYNNNIAYKILDIVNVYNFLNSDNSINKQVLGLYVHEKKGDHVLQRDNKFLICETIEEATIVEENA
jgi:hypothetical protein